jgi:hypothetical protein
MVELILSSARRDVHALKGGMPSELQELSGPEQIRTGRKTTRAIGGRAGAAQGLELSDFSARALMARSRNGPDG